MVGRHCRVSGTHRPRSGAGLKLGASRLLRPRGGDGLAGRVAPDHRAEQASPRWPGRRVPARDCPDRDGRDRGGLAGETRPDSLVELLRHTRAGGSCPWGAGGQGGEGVRVGAGLARVVGAGWCRSRNSHDGAKDDSSAHKQFRDHFRNFLPFFVMAKTDGHFPRRSKCPSRSRYRSIATRVQPSSDVTVLASYSLYEPMKPVKVVT